MTTIPYDDSATKAVATPWSDHVEDAVRLIGLGCPDVAVLRIESAMKIAPIEMVPMLSCWRNAVRSTIPYRVNLRWPKWKGLKEAAR